MANLNYVDVLDLVNETESIITEVEYRLSHEDREKTSIDGRSINIILDRLKLLSTRVRNQM